MQKKIIDFFKYEPAPNWGWLTIIYFAFMFEFPYFTVKAIERVAVAMGLSPNLMKFAYNNIYLHLLIEVVMYLIIIGLDRYIALRKNARLLESNLSTEQIVHNKLFAFFKRKKSKYLFDNGYRVKPYSDKLFFKLFVLTVSLCNVLNYILTVLDDYIPENEVSKSLEELYASHVLLMMFSAMVIAPIFEELICRKILLIGSLRYGVPKNFAIVFSAVVFAVVHRNIRQGIVAFVVGLLFAYVVYYTGRVVYTMFMHFLYNTLTLFNSVSYNVSANGSLNIKAHLVFVVSLILLVLFSYIVYKSDELKPRPAWTIDPSQRYFK